MQKKLLTIAVAGALAAPCIALAQSSVEVYGTIHMAFGKFKYSEPSTAPTAGANAPAGTGSISKWDVAQSSSNYGLRGRENLGAGLTAWFQIESNAPMERSNNAATTPASRNSAVGLQGGFGNVFLGMWTTPWADLDALWSIGTVGPWGPVTSIIGRRETSGTAPNPNCGNGHGVAGTCDAVDSQGGVGHPFWRRFSQAVFYQSPVFSGVQIKAAYQTNESKANAPGSVNIDPAAWSSSIQWAGMGGRARIGAAYDRHKDYTSAGNSDTGYAIKGGWNFGVVDVGLAYETMKYKCGLVLNDQPATTNAGWAVGQSGDIKAKQYSIALAVPVGQGAIRGSYAVAKDLEGSVLAAQADTGAKEYNIGYDHPFSKRTTVGVGYAVIKNDTAASFTCTGAPPPQNGAATSPFRGSDPSTYFVSIIHRF